MLPENLNLRKSGLSLERLETFLKVANAGSIAAAADREPNRQSQYSRQIRELEKSLETQLFLREGKRFELNTVGRELAELALAWFKGLDDLLEKQKKRPRAISVGAGDSVLRWVILPLLDRLREEDPHLQLNLQNLRTSKIREGLENGSLDIGIMRKEGLTRKLISEPVMVMDFGLFFPRGEDFVGEVSLKAIFQGRFFASLIGEGPYTEAFETLALKHGVDPFISVRTESLLMLREAMRASRLAGFLPLNARKELESEGFRSLKKVDLSEFRREYVLAHNPASAKIRPLISRAAKMIADRFKNNPKA